MENKGIMKAALIIAIIGALNWGLIGFFNWNLVDAIFGGGSREQTSAFSRVIYAVVGIAGLVGLIGLLRGEGARVARQRPATT